MPTHPFGAAPETYPVIYSDLRQILKGKANVDQESFPVDVLLDRALPALCRRFCEMAATVGRDMMQYTSADVLACTGHDRENKILDLSIYESFPSYGLDRVIIENEGYWNLHTHQVHYGSNNPKHNRSIVAKALLARANHDPPPRWEDNLDDTLNTPTEQSSNIQSIRILIPKDLSDFEQIDTGQVVAADVIYYKPTHPAADTRGHKWVGVEIDRWHEMEHVVGELYHLSKATSLNEDARKSAMAKIGSFLASEGKTLKDIAVTLYKLAFESVA